MLVHLSFLPGFLAGLAGLLAVTVFAPMDANARKAWVLVGQLGTFDDDGNFCPPSQWALDEARNAMNQAIEDYEKAGYEVCSEFDAFPRHFYDAVNDTDTAAVWFLGHGGGKDSSTEVGDLFFTTSNGDANIVRSNDRNLEGTFPHIEQVTIHACRQFKPAWSDKFPNANFIGWRGCPSLVSVYWWQFFHCYDPVDSEGISASTLVPPARVSLFIHPRLQIAGHDFFMDETEGALSDMTPAANHTNSFVLVDPLLNLFNNASFNVFLAGGILPGEHHFFTVTIRNGALDVASQRGFDPSADFDLVLDGESLRQTLMTDPNEWNLLSKDPALVRVRNLSGRAGELQILAACGTVLFGVPQQPSLAIATHGGDMTLGFNAQSGVAYQIQATDGLPPMAWRAVTTLSTDSPAPLAVSMTASNPSTYLRARAHWDQGCVYLVKQVVSGTCDNTNVVAGALLCVSPCPPSGELECPPPNGNQFTLLSPSTSGGLNTNCVVEVSQPHPACAPCAEAGAIRAEWVAGQLLYLPR